MWIGFTENSNQRFKRGRVEIKLIKKNTSGLITGSGLKSIQIN
jgi:hypothetical protein